ncbi:MAG: hypothetical protein C0594_05590 [Marinilabiliales bacterium]|nr:MAG: hypothetical protein C0594_05590 [Marinilabiliales bacterium]
MNKISYPQQSYKDCKQALNNYWTAYNDLVKIKGCNNKICKPQTLKQSHKGTMLLLIKAYAAMLFDNNRTFRDMPEYRELDPGNLPGLFTNRVKISKAVGCSPSTAYRQIERLQEAGMIIDKKFHGTRRDFELFINPDLLLIIDLLNPNYTPNSPLLSDDPDTHFRAIADALRAKRSLHNIRDNNNNLTSTVKRSDGTSPAAVQESENRSTPGVNTKSVNRQEGEKNNETTGKNTKPAVSCPPGSARPPQKEKPDLDWYKERFTNWFIGLMIQVLYAGRNIYPGEELAAKQYFKEIYLAKVTNTSQLGKLELQFKWRIHAVERYCKNKGYKIENYPRRYLDVNNYRSGFTQTRDWYLKHIQNLKRKQQISIKQKDHRKLMRYFNLMLDNWGSLSTYNRCISGIRDKIPHLEDDFNRWIQEGKMSDHTRNENFAQNANKYTDNANKYTDNAN